MKYADVVYAAPGDAPAGMPSTFPLKGFRIIPVLGAAATIAEVLAAYASLVVRVSRGSNARQISGVAPVGINDDLAVPGPDWIRSPGFNALNLQGGQVGVTYRVFWAEDCYEVMDPGTSPMMNGFNSSAPAVATPASDSVAQLANSLLNIPVGAVGVAVPSGARGAYAVVSAQAAATLVGAGSLVWWRYSYRLGRWAETTVQDALTGGARDNATPEQLLNGEAGDRIWVEARGVTVSAGANVTILLNIY